MTFSAAVSRSLQCSSGSTSRRDTFLLVRDCGEDVILDFEKGVDRIDVKGQTFTMVERSGDSVLEFALGDAVNVVGVTASPAPISLLDALVAR